MLVFVFLYQVHHLGLTCAATIERAKRKVKEIMEQKKPAFTLAQSCKSGNRVAHKATVKSLNSTNQV